MRIRVVWMMSVLALGFVMSGPSLAQDVVNILDNGGFEDGVVGPWSTYGGVTMTIIQDDPAEGQHYLQLDVAAAGANFWNSGLQHSGHVFEQGKDYTLSAFVRCEQGELDINFKPELGADPWTGYGSQAFTMTEEWQEFSVYTGVMGADVDPATITFHIGYAAATLYIDGVRFYEGEYVAPVFVMQTEASNPGPPDAAADIAQDIILGWSPSEYAATHNLYFGTNFDDVNTATAANPMGVLVSQGQEELSYDPEGLLEFGQTYYWRVDEVNAAPDSTVFAGPVWSFTVEPYSYAVDGASISVMASSEHAANVGAGNTIDGSGLNALDEHGTLGTDMWLSEASPDGAWIQYEFAQVLMLDEMWVWNSNQLVESFIGFGFNAVVVESSLDGATWTVLEDITQFAQAPGAENYAANTIVDMGGVMARFVRITALSNYGTLTQFGLSEVRFYYAPIQAREPQPASGASNAGPDLVLRWRGGRGATAHEVLFSSNRDEVIDGSALVATVDENRYVPDALNYGTYYYWAVNEINADASIAGELWSFSTPESLVLDDFEAYNDDCKRIFFTWLDGWGHNGGENIEGCDVAPYNGNLTGSLVGNDQAPFAERSVVNSGRQAMPLDFDNSIEPYYSETSSADWALPQDWTQGSAENLSVAFRGNPVDFVENTDGSITMSGAGADIYNTTDEFRFAYKELSGDGSITVRIDSLTDVADWAKAGVMIREGLEPGNLQADMIITPRERVEWMYRDQILGNTTGPATDVGTTPFPHWVRLTRSGNTLTGQHSVDGVTWTPLTPDESSTVDLDFIPPVYIGLAVTSNAPGTPAVAEFSNVTITGASGPWQVEGIGVEQTSNDAEAVYIVVEDNAGQDKTITYPDPAATQLADWQEWIIPLTEFDNLNLAAIKSVSIGVGDRNNPQAGGTGKLFVDDIQIGTTLPDPLPPIVEDTGNLLVNGGFEDGVLEPWTTYGDVTTEIVPGAGAEGDHSLHITVNSIGDNSWNTGLQHQGHVFEAGKSYTMSAFLRSQAASLDVHFKPEMQGDPWTGFGAQTFTITDEWTEYSVSTGVIPQHVDPGSVTFHIGFAPGELWVDGVRFYEGDYVSVDDGGSGGANLLANGGFEDGVTDPWSIYGDAAIDVFPDDAVEGDNSLLVTVNTAGDNPWNVGLQHQGHVFASGKSYTLSTFVKSLSGDMPVTLNAELGADPWTKYIAETVTITEEWTEYSASTGVIDQDVDPGTITFHIGATAGQFLVDDVRFYEN